ncbi:NmrA-like oxidoreductase [Pleurotus pulmonarius]
MSKLILVIGATGAQGIAVIDAVLSAASDGSPSPYSVRALTRDPSSRRAQELAAKGVECVQGAFDNLQSVAAAFEGVYGAWVNTDGFTVGEQKEIYAGLKIFEIAKRTPSVRHYVWSNLDYASKKSGYSPEHKCEHYDGKGRVAEFMK